MCAEIIELSQEEILAVAGGGQIDPPARANSIADNDFPEIENVPPR